MELMEIILLSLGIVLFFVSFFIGEKKTDENSAESISEEEIRRLVQDEFEKTRDKLNNITDETVNYSVEKAERQLEKITNEKMMAMGEYSDTIMNQINTSHQEVVFLSDMLSKNKNDLTIMLGQAMKDAKEAMENSGEAVEKSRLAKEEAGNALEISSKAAQNGAVAEEKMIAARKFIQSDAAEADINNIIDARDTNDDNEPDNRDGVKKRKRKNKDNEPSENDNNDVMSDIESIAISEPVKKKTVRRKKKSDSNDSFEGTQISLQFDTDSDSADNSNEKILNLHKMGKSNVAIAKELGLGVGEVKLVIDLFKD